MQISDKQHLEFVDVTTANYPFAIEGKFVDKSREKTYFLPIALTVASGNKIGKYGIYIARINSLDVLIDQSIRRILDPLVPQQKEYTADFEIRLKFNNGAEFIFFEQSNGSLQISGPFISAPYLFTTGRIARKIKNIYKNKFGIRVEKDDINVRISYGRSRNMLKLNRLRILDETGKETLTIPLNKKVDIEIEARSIDPDTTKISVKIVPVLIEAAPDEIDTSKKALLRIAMGKAGYDYEEQDIPESIRAKNDFIRWLKINRRLNSDQLSIMIKVPLLKKTETTNAQCAQPNIADKNGWLRSKTINTDERGEYKEYEYVVDASENMIFENYLLPVKEIEIQK